MTRVSRLVSALRVKRGMKLCPMDSKGRLIARDQWWVGWEGVEIGTREASTLIRESGGPPAVREGRNREINVVVEKLSG